MGSFHRLLNIYTLSVGQLIPVMFPLYPPFSLIYYEFYSLPPFWWPFLWLCGSETSLLDLKQIQQRNHSPSATGLFLQQEQSLGFIFGSPFHHRSPQVQAFCQRNPCLCRASREYHQQSLPPFRDKSGTHAT